MTLTRDKAKALLYEWVQSESLRKHCLGVAFAMEGYAIKKGLSEEEVSKYWITGLMHDFDYERFPTLEKHPFEGVKFLKEMGVEEEILDAILGHADYSGVKRESDLAKTLFAVDELSGFVIALAKVRPLHFSGMSAKSVKKALKKKDFAAAISRDDVNQGVEEMKVDRDGHFELVIGSLRRNAGELGFN